MLKAPKYAPDAKADVRGWRDRVTGELLEVRRHTVEEVEEYEAARAGSKLVGNTPHTIIVDDPLDEGVDESQIGGLVEFEDLTKDELLEQAELLNIEVFKSWTKAEIIEAIKSDLEEE